MLSLEFHSISTSDSGPSRSRCPQKDPQGLVLCVSVQAGSHACAALPSNFTTKAYIQALEWQVVKVSSMTQVQQCTEH